MAFAPKKRNLNPVREYLQERCRGPKPKRIGHMRAAVSVYLGDAIDKAFIAGLNDVAEEVADVAEGLLPETMPQCAREIAIALLLPVACAAAVAAADALSDQEDSAA